MADLSKIKLNGTTYNLKDTEAREELNNLAVVAISGDYNDLINKPIYQQTTVNNNTATSYSDRMNFMTGDSNEEFLFIRNFNFPHTDDTITLTIHYNNGNEDISFLLQKNDDAYYEYYEYYEDTEDVIFQITEDPTIIEDIASAFDASGWEDSTMVISKYYGDIIIDSNYIESITIPYITSTTENVSTEYFKEGVKSFLAKVASTGSYQDLKNTPNIQSIIDNRINSNVEKIYHIDLNSELYNESGEYNYSGAGFYDWEAYCNPDIYTEASQAFSEFRLVLLHLWDMCGIAVRQMDNYLLFLFVDDYGSEGGVPHVLKFWNNGHLNSDGDIVLPGYLDVDDVPGWARAASKPTYTAAEVGALPKSTVIPTVTDTYSASSKDAMSGIAVNSAITSAIGNINSFDVEIIANTANVSSPNNHTIYFVPQAVNSSTHDEYMYINNNWELIGTTAIDLSGYLQSSDIAAWAKASTKPSYTASEVGAMSTSHAANAITAQDISNWNAKPSSDTNTTYSLSISGNRITLTPSSGTTTYVDLPVYNGGVK